MRFLTKNPEYPDRRSRVRAPPERTLGKHSKSLSGNRPALKSVVDEKQIVLSVKECLRILSVQLLQFAFGTLFFGINYETRIVDSLGSAQITGASRRGKTENMNNERVFS